jgi:hypothetical protein
MSFYADGQYQSRGQEVWATLTASLTGTGVAVTGAMTAATALKIPPFIRRSVVTAANLIVLTSSALNPIVNFYNGTGTGAFLTGTIGTATVGQVVKLTVTAANSTFAAGDQITGTLTGTATSAGSLGGAWDVWAESQELYQS